MARLLFGSDLHCHNHAQFAHTLPNGRNSRLQDCLGIIWQLRRIAIERDCRAVFLLGDLFHVRTTIDMDVYSSTWDAIKCLADAVRVYLLLGNHDCHNKVGDVHSLSAFAPICNVIDRPTLINEGCEVFAHPYTPDVPQLLKTVGEQKGDLLLLHQAMREGAVGPYGMTGHGELSVKDLRLDDWKYVFAGDYHKRQWVVPNKVHYIGSPLQLTFGEANEFKAFTLLDTETWTTEDIPTTAPRFFVYDTPAAFQAAMREGLVRPDIDFVRVLYDEEQRATAEQVKVECDRVQIVEESQQAAVLQRIGNEVASSEMLLLESYVEQRAGALDRDRLVAVGLDELWGSDG